MSRRSSPFDEVERLLDRLTGEIDESLLVEGEMAVDVKRREDDYVVRADLPGYDRDDVTVEVGDGALTIRADRESESRAEEGEYVRRERRQESVRRTIDLPGPVAADGATASYDGGVLTVTLPKAGEDDGREIDIE